MSIDHVTSNPLRGITLAVLAGGAGTRMGLPKSMLRIADEPILRWLLRHYAWPGPTLLITAPGTPTSDGADAFDRQGVDAVDGNGPLEGVKTALQIASTELVAVVTVDMPEMETSHLAWLARELARSPGQLGIMCRQVSTAGKIEPFPCILRRAALERVENNLASGRRAVRSLCDEPLFIALQVPPDWPERIWLNLNIPEQLAEFVGRQRQAEDPS